MEIPSKDIERGNSDILANEDALNDDEFQCHDHCDDVQENAELDGLGEMDV